MCTGDMYQDQIITHFKETNMKSKLMLFAFTLGISLSAFAAKPSTQCTNECRAELNECMAEVPKPGGPRPQQCVTAFNACKKACG